jgi:hypothetical protein
MSLDSELLLLQQVFGNGIHALYQYYFRRYTLHQDGLKVTVVYHENNIPHEITQVDLDVHR